MPIGTHASAGTYAVLLAGDHEGIGHAEVTALEAADGMADPEMWSGSRIRLTPSAYAAQNAAQGMAWGENWLTVDATEEGLRLAARAVRHRTSGEGTAALRLTRVTGGSKEIHQQAIDLLGPALTAAGHTINLEKPDVLVFVWIEPNKVTIGELRGVRGGRHQARIMEKRGHFSPIGLHPVRAATLVHLARVPSGGRILDPFCGTGGIVLEAALEGYDAWGSDLDPWMVQGTHQALADAGPEPLDATVFQADIGDVPNLADGIQGIATDMPYGKASTTDREALASLYDRALASFADILQPGGLAVVGHMDQALLETAPDHGLDPATWGRQRKVDSHEEYVHATMTRHYTVLRRR